MNTAQIRTRECHNVSEHGPHDWEELNLLWECPGVVGPRKIAPVTLKNSETGSWLRTWTNGAEILIRTEASDGHLVGNPARLSANVYRPAGSKDWEVRVFVTGRHVAEQQSVVSRPWTLRMARQLLAYLATDWAPTGDDVWWLRQQLQKAVHKAWVEASGAEIERIQAD